jgi:transposase
LYRRTLRDKPSHGFVGGKLMKGKKRHVLVDTLGLLLHALVTSADVQDRDGGLMVLSTLFGQFPFLQELFADSAYAEAYPVVPGSRASSALAGSAPS